MTEDELFARILADPDVEVICAPVFSDTPHSTGALVLSTHGLWLSIVHLPAGQLAEMHKRDRAGRIRALLSHRHPDRVASELGYLSEGS